LEAYEQATRKFLNHAGSSSDERSPVSSRKKKEKREKKEKKERSSSRTDRKRESVDKSPLSHVSSYDKQLLSNMLGGYN
jgi:hypothetical protein